MTTIAVLQPSYLPWAGVFHQMWRSDVFVFYNDVQYTVGDWRNRNRIRTALGWQWLTVPVIRKGKFGQMINDVEINSNTDWGRQHLASIKQNYSKARFFDELFPLMEMMLSRRYNERTKLSVMTTAITACLAEKLGIETELVLSSELNISGSQTSRLVNICKHFNADHYYSGAAARNYLDIKQFEEAGISVEFQDYKHPVYKQVYEPFISHLSVIDLMFNEGPRSLEILTGGNKCKYWLLGEVAL